MQQLVIGRIRRSVKATPRWRGVLAGVLLAATHCHAEVVPESVPYAALRSLSAEQLRSFQLKVTYMSVQSFPYNTVLLHSETTSPDVSILVPFRKPELLARYSNDDKYRLDIGPLRVGASPGQSDAEKLVEAIGTLSVVTDGGTASSPFLAVEMAVRGATFWKGFDSVLTHAESVKLFGAIHTALTGNAAALKSLRYMKCGLDLLGPLRPADVTSSARLEYSALRLDQATGHYLGEVAITNTSSVPLPSPLSLMLSFEGEAVELSNRTAHSCVDYSVHEQYIDVDAGLSPGESMRIPIEVQSSQGEAILPHARVLAGPGER